MSKWTGSYVERAGGERTVFGIAVSVQSPGEPPDPVDLWRIEQEIEDHLGALFGEDSVVGVAIQVSSPRTGDAPEWLIVAATPESVRKFLAARNGDTRSVRAEIPDAD
jgi:hypothetical protein